MSDVYNERNYLLRYRTSEVGYSGRTLLLMMLGMWEVVDKYKCIPGNIIC